VTRVFQPTPVPGFAVPHIFAPPREPTNILLIDDQKIVAEAVRGLLASDPHLHLHYCPDPGVAIDTANSLFPTVILLDIIMPDTDGLDLLRRFRENAATAETPIVVFSAKDDPRAKRDAFAAGASDYLVKLPDQVELIARVRYHSQACLNQRRKNEIATQLYQSQQALAERVAELQSALEERLRFRTELESAYARLARESFLDTLTETLNRRGLEHQLAVELGRAAREGVPLYAVLADCDTFKAVNDTYGYDVGDYVLKELARRIASVVRPGDHVARVGGDEFLVLLSDVNTDQAMAMAERMRAAVADQPIVVARKPTQQTISVAVFQVPASARSTTDVLGSGTAALHESKRAGRNRVSAVVLG
jgi:two-component system, chemotaxis family, response regulator WspR